MTLTCIGLALPRRKATYKPRGHYSSKAKAHPGTLPPRVTLGLAASAPLENLREMKTLGLHSRLSESKSAF